MTFSLVKHNNNSISAITSGGSLGIGKLVLIKTQTASSVSSVSFVHGSSDVVLDGTYPIYLFKVINMHPATDNVDLLLNFSSDSGSAYDRAKTTVKWGSFNNESDNDRFLGIESGRDLNNSTSDHKINSFGGDSADSDHGHCVEMYLFKPSDTTFSKHFLIRAPQVNNGDYIINAFDAGYINTSSAVNGVRFSFNSGNVDSGTFKLYGIQGS
tara:strand:- start:650 stop:1285 length:636 start_codon:yes stop_codon:yes gene_type:complete